MTDNKLKLSELLFLVMVISLLLFIPGDLNYLNHGYLSGFAMQNWSVNYSTGFVLRGLPGTIMSMLFKPITTQEVMYITYVFLAAYLVYVFIITKAIFKTDRNIYNLVFLLFILVQPPVLQRWISSSAIGRLDVVLVVIFISVVFILVKSKKPAVSYAAANILTLIALLCHEGFAMFFVPIIFSVFLIKEQKTLRAFILYLIPSGISWALIIFFGGADVPIDQLMAMIGKNISPESIHLLYPSSIETVYYTSISEKLKYTIDYYNETIAAKVLLTFVLMSPAIYCLAGYWKSLIKTAESKKEKTILILMPVFALSPLASLFFATDTYRWIGFAFFNQCAGIVILYLQGEKYKNAILSYTQKRQLMVIIALVLALLVGYFTVYSPYPIIEKYFPSVYNFFFG